MKRKWINVHKKIPYKGQYVMVPFGKKIAVCAAVDEYGTLREITSMITKSKCEIWLYPEPEWGDGYVEWMPLPDLPTEVNQ